MANYTKKNLRDVEDMAPKFNLQDVNEARFASKDLMLERSGLSYQKLFSGKSHGAGHKHAEQEEVYIILSGTGTMQLDNEKIEVKPLDAIRVAPETARGFTAANEDLEFIVYGAPKGENNDAEML